MGKEEQRLRRRLTSDELVEEGKRKAVKAWHKVLPFGAQVLASAAAYSVGITATQLLGFVLKVSCATPVLGPAVGIMGVGVANVLAGQASKHTRKLLVDGANPRKPGFWEKPDVEDLVLDAVLGAAIFKAMGGRFSSLMPSNLAKPGALAFESIPAKVQNSEDYATAGMKRELARIFRRDGCHHCGSRRGPVIGDHMPPNKVLAASSKDRLQAWVVEVPVVGKLVELLAGGRRARGPLQRFFPQCQRCSIKQAVAVRSGKRMLVLHLHWPRGRAEHLAGVFVGLRYNVPALAASADSRRSARWASLTLTSAADAHAHGSCLVEEASGTRVFNEYLQQLAPVIGPPPGSSGLAPQPWGSSRGMSGATSSHLLAVAPLSEGPATAAAGGNGGWQQQQQVAAGSRGGSQAAFAGKGQQERHAGSKSTVPAGRGAGQQQHHHHQQQQRGLSAAGDERRPDQDAMCYSDAHSAALMVSLAAWAPGPPQPPAAPPAAAALPAAHQQQRPAQRADAAMAPEHAKQRAEAAFERHFAAGSQLCDALELRMIVGGK